MSLSYDVFIDMFLDKISEFDFLQMGDYEKMKMTDGYMKRAIAGFRKNCKYDLTSTADDVVRLFFVDIPQEDIDEIADIVSEGMVVQWLKPYANRQELYEQILNTRDFTTSSPAELVLRISNKYKESFNNYNNMIREYSYNHGDLTGLHI